MKVDTIFSQAGAEIVAQPFLVSEELERLAVAASEDFVRSLPAAVLSAGEEEPVPVALEILNGGRYYFLPRAYENVCGRSCRVSQLRAKRGHASAETYGGPAHLDKDLPPGTELWRSKGSDWCVRIWDIDELPRGPLLVGDTIGTGTTLAGVLGWVVEKMEAADAVYDIFVFTIAGAAAWDTDGGVLAKLAPIDESLRRHGRELHVTFANGRFALQKNGTDMNPCPSMGAELHPKAKTFLQEKIGAQFLKSMKCAVWDWGDRFRKPLQHLEDVEAHFREQENCPHYILEGIRGRLETLRVPEACQATAPDTNSFQEPAAKRPRVGSADAAS